MFGKSRVERRLEWIESDLKGRIEALEKRYWELLESHARLMDELGYSERPVMAHTRLVKKGGPEHG